MSKLLLDCTRLVMRGRWTLPPLEPELSVPFNANLKFLIHSEGIGEGRNAFFIYFQMDKLAPGHRWSAKIALNPSGSIFEAHGKFPGVKAHVWLTNLEYKCPFFLFFFFLLLLLLLFAILKVISLRKVEIVQELLPRSSSVWEAGRMKPSHVSVLVSLCEYVVGCVCWCTFN